ncbi:ribbon-helix-helix protein, CopG family [Nocardia sp. NPDC050697]|uniref:ribbon-helix-helix protein, CopG family n=1 Tax=Nocardia sp. NPDC050697 TaxID=3155158 RepID=UPI00340B36E2
MVKATVYLPEELALRLDAEVSATGVSKAELIRRGIAMLLDASDRPRNDAPLPVFRSGRSRDADEVRNGSTPTRMNTSERCGWWSRKP